MILINTTYQIPDNNIQAWLGWLKSTYLPSVLKSGILRNPRLNHVLAEMPEGQSAYALQFEVESFELLEKWSETEGSVLRTSMHDVFKDEITGFTTLMETIAL